MSDEEPEFQIFDHVFVPRPKAPWVLEATVPDVGEFNLTHTSLYAVGYRPFPYSAWETLATHQRASVAIAAAEHSIRRKVAEAKYYAKLATLNLDPEK